NHVPAGRDRAAAHGGPLAQRHGRIPSAAGRPAPRGGSARAGAGFRIVSSVAAAPRILFLKVHWSDRIAHAILIAAGLALAVFLLAPLAMILMKSAQNRAGEWVGFANFVDYFRTPALARSIWNSVWVSTLVTLVTIPLAFTFAYGLTRSCMRFKVLLRNVALVPILAPSLLAAISFIFWFGNQGLLKGLLMG